MSAVRRLVETVLFVDDVEQSVRFYRDVLGLTVISPPTLPGVFLQVGEAGAGVPQQIVLVPRPAGAQRAASKAERGLHHLGLEVDPADFASERERLSNLGYELRDGQHPFMSVEAFYLDDPDGNEVEIVTRP